MSSLDVSLMHNILSIQSHSRETDKMTRFIVRHLKRRGLEVVVDNGNVYAAKGQADVYPCIVAHTDTVHNIVPRDQYKVLRQKDMFFGWNPVKNDFTGVGGDDKVGIFLALAALNEFDAIKVAFFRDEEIGCVGSALANMEFFKDCAFVLQGDRRGNDDFVNSIYSTNLQSAEFKAAVAPILKEYGYKTSSGALTDVYELATSGVGLAVANFSCGYHNPHTSKEFIDLDDVANCQAMVYAIIRQLGDKQWKHTASKSYSTYSGTTYKKGSRKYTTGGTQVYGWRDDDDWEEGYGYYNRSSDDYVGKWTSKAKNLAPSEMETFGEDGGFGVVTITDDGCCPYCKLDDLLEFDSYMAKWYCERCVEYLGDS